MKISASQARRLVIGCQGLSGGPSAAAGKQGVARTVEHLGHVQIDTIAVVARAHHHTLWSRCADYAPAMLHELQAVDRRVFEYWRHAACYLPMCDYRYYVPRMRAYASGGRTRRFLDANRELAGGVLARIRAEGALRSADFAAPAGEKRGPWWDWKPAKHALEALFNTGELMVTERRNFQRVYDLAERVLPAGVDTSEPTPAEAARFRVGRAIAAQGVPQVRDADLPAAEELADAGEAVAVEIAGLDGGVRYAPTAALEKVSRRRRGKKPLHLLSPFDNAVHRRGRLHQLFGFDYKLECYHPAAKRRYGYFCLPILWGEEFVGRLDPKADRKARTLIVRKLMLEPGFDGGGAFFPQLAARLRTFAEFNECDEVVVEQARPVKARAALRRELR